MSECGCFQFAPDDPVCARFGLGAAALRYAAMGYAVLPLMRGAKRPHRMLGERGGVHHASTSPVAVESWWSQDRSANIGVATGSPSRLAVVDLDVKHGSDGLAEYESFTTAYGLPMPHVLPLQSTPSGGVHLWLRTPAGMTVPERPGILPGVDVKGDGGYVVAAPSMVLVQPMQRPGEQAAGVEIPVPYRWTGCPHMAPPAPDWMYQWLATAVAQGSPQPQHDDLPDGGGELPTVESLAKTGIAPGYRNRTIYLLACSLFRRIGTDPASAEIVMGKLREVWEATDHHDFAWQEVVTSAASARRFVERSRQQDIERTRSYLAYRPPWERPQ